jgi:hypothetical protein
MELQSQFSNDETPNTQPLEHERHPLTVASPTETEPKKEFPPIEVTN